MNPSFQIIGSGMGGGTLAIKLVEMGFDVTLFDIDLSLQTSEKNFESVGIDFRHETTLSYQLGGGSNLWHGVTAPMDVIDFTSRDGLTKYLTYEEMLCYWTKASEFLGFKTKAMMLDDITCSSIRKMVYELPFNKSQLQPKLYKVLNKPARLNEKLIDLELSGLLKIHRGAEVKCVNIDKEKNIINSITVYTNAGDFCSEVKVENLVISCGAINTVRVLLNSELFKNGELYNPNGLLGKGYFDHPMGFLGKIIFDKPLSARMYSDLPVAKNEKLRLGLTPKDSKKYGNTNIYFRPSTSVINSRESDRLLLSLIKVKSIKEVNLKIIWMFLNNPTVFFRAFLNKYSLPIKYRAADMFFVSEQTINLNSKIYLDEKKDKFGFSKVVVDWQVSAVDYQKINNLFEMIKRDYSKMSGVRMIDYPVLDKWKDTHTSAAHHLGGVAMGNSIDNSIVNENLAIHGLNNAWICDGSVLPAVGNSNPSLTIIALAIRLSEHLKIKFR